MAIRLVGTFTVVDDAPNPDLKVAPETPGGFPFSVETGTAFKQRVAEVLQPLIDADAAHLAALQLALAQSQT